MNLDPARSTDYVLRLELAQPNRVGKVVATAHFNPSGEVEVVSQDLDQFDRSLAVLAAARFADLPISPFSRNAVERMFEQGAAVSGSRKSLTSRRSVYELITDAADSGPRQAQMDELVRRHFETVVGAFATMLIEAMVSRAIEESTEDTSDSWQPDDRLMAQRDRILRFENEAPMSATEIGRFLNVSRTTLASRRRNGAVLGLPLGSERKLVYPRWQFDPARPTHLLPGLQAVFATLAVQDPWGVADLLTSRHPALDGQTPIDRLRDSNGADAHRISSLLASEYLETTNEAMPKQTPNQIHVVKREAGWGAVRPGAKRSSINIEPTQAAAEKAAKDLARRSGGAEVITHGRNGQIRSSDTIGKPDPYPPIDREH